MPAPLYTRTQTSPTPTTLAHNTGMRVFLGAKLVGTYFPYCRSNVAHISTFVKPCWKWLISSRRRRSNWRSWTQRRWWPMLLSEFELLQFLGDGTQASCVNHDRIDNLVQKLIENTRPYTTSLELPNSSNKRGNISGWCVSHTSIASTTRDITFSRVFR